MLRRKYNCRINSPSRVRLAPTRRRRTSPVETIRVHEGTPQSPNDPIDSRGRLASCGLWDDDTRKVEKDVRRASPDDYRQFSNSGLRRGTAWRLERILRRRPYLGGKLDSHSPS